MSSLGVRRPVTLIYPRGTCKRKTFYTRGDDQFKEPEWNDNIKRDLKMKLNRAQTNFDEMQREYNSVFADLDETEGYTLRLAATTGDDSNPTTESAKLRQDIHDLLQQLDEIATEIENINKDTKFNEINLLEKEVACLQPQIEALNLKNSTTEQLITDNQKRIGDLITSQEYELAVDAIMERRVATKCRALMKDTLQTLHKQIDAAPSKENSKRTSAANSVRTPEVHDLLDDLTELKLTETEVLLQKNLAQEHRRQSIKALVARIEEMNDVIRILGKEGVDIAEVKEHVHYDEIVQEEQEISDKQKEERKKVNDRPLKTRRQK